MTYACCAYAVAKCRRAASSPAEDPAARGKLLVAQGPVALSARARARKRYTAVACLPLLYGVSRDVVQFFRDWYFQIGFDRVFAYVRDATETFDIEGVTWFVTPQCFILGSPPYKGKLWYVRASVYVAHKCR